MRKFLIIILWLSLLFNNENHVVINNKSSGYTGYLIIPSVDMLYGFFPMDDFRNNIAYNIEILNGSKEGSLFIAAHSGEGEIAFFNDLEKLKIDDVIFIKYNGNSYQYNIKEIYLEEKDGDINVIKKDSESILVLTTCSQNNKGFQLVVKALLV